MQHGGMMGGAKAMPEGHDGTMSAQSRMGMEHSYAMTTFDTDNDGKISTGDITAGIQAERKTYDTDGNGILSFEEFAVMHMARTGPMTVRVFQVHDSDGDAQVTEAEMAAMAEMMQRRMSERQGGMHDMDKDTMRNN